jgi:hypothetical protein
MQTLTALLSENGLPNLPIVLIKPHRGPAGSWRVMSRTNRFRCRLSKHRLWLSVSKYCRRLSLPSKSMKRFKVFCDTIECTRLVRQDHPECPRQRLSEMHMEARRCSLGPKPARKTRRLSLSGWGTKNAERGHPNGRRCHHGRARALFGRPRQDNQRPHDNREPNAAATICPDCCRHPFSYARHKGYAKRCSAVMGSR